MNYIGFRNKCNAYINPLPKITTNHLLIGERQIFASINYMIDTVNQFVDVETIYLGN